MTLPEIKQHAQELALDDLQEALEFLRSELPAGSPVTGTILSMLRRLNKAVTNARKGLISMADMEIIENQIFDSLLGWLRELNEAKLVQGASGGTGKILYDIPRQMKVQEELRCRIRLAFLEEIIKQNADLSDDVEIHDIPVGEVMSVELVDPAAEPVFSIRTISDEVQRIDPDFYSEWWFYITPLKEGRHELVLRVSVIEQVDGVDRRRNMVMEEVIDIMQMVPAGASEAKFRETPYVVAMSSTGLPEEQEEAEIKIKPRPKVKPGAPDPPKVKAEPQSPKRSKPSTIVEPAPFIPSPEPAPPPRRKSRMATINRWLMYTVVGFAVFTAASYAMVPGVRSELNWWMAGDSKSALEEYVSEHPNSHRAVEAMERINELEILERRRIPDEQVPERVDVPDLHSENSVLGGALRDRDVLSRPAYDSQVRQRGRVVVKVCVDAAGDVTRASISPSETDLADQRLRQVALQNAKQWKFAKSSVAQECGTILYEFGVE
jgi:hypothetical protein